MLTSIRKGTQNLFVKIILGLLALSFVGVGGAQFINGNSGGDIVSFSKADSISAEEFYRARAKEIDSLQRENNINLSAENIAELKINSRVLTKLVNSSMLEYLAKYYDYDVSEKSIINRIKSIPSFQNQNGEFDTRVFQYSLRDASITEKKYLEMIHQELIISSMYSVFNDSFHTPKLMIENLVEYFSEARNVDLFYVDLEHKDKGYNAPEISPEKLAYFYDNNQPSFVVPELRSFQYIKSNPMFLQKKLNISDSNLKKYFEENKEDFPGSDFASVKKDVMESYRQEKLENLSSEFTKNLETDVSSGLTLEEISKKYDLPISNVKDISLFEMNSSAKQEYAQMADSVFEMTENELSYPIEMQDQNEILLVGLSSITPSRQKPLGEVENEIRSILIKNDVAISNANKLSSVKKEYASGNKTTAEKLKTKNIFLTSNKSFNRSDIQSYDKFPEELLGEIFSMKNKESTKVVIGNNKAYFAYLKNIKPNKTKSDKIRKNSQDRFSSVIKEGLMAEMILYLTKQNNIQIDKSKIQQ